MEFKDYQEAVLKRLDDYLDELKIRKVKADEVEALRRAHPDLPIPESDYCGDAWKALAGSGKLPAFRNATPYSRRIDGIGRAVPNVTLKIPTGGGKTLLATASVSRIFGSYLGTNTGLVLWIVPNEAIYAQTKRTLSDRDHPYRQMLDRSAAGRVKLLEKSDPLNRRDLDANLCVMLLMMASANRETKETLRLFRDRGNVHGFFPEGDDFDAHFELLQAIPNLSAYNNQDGNNRGSIIQDSLGNVLRLTRPVVIIDEGHKAVSKGAMNTVYDFNPCFVLELSATPKDRMSDIPPTYANWLVDVRGSELAKEDMIKLPITLKVKAGDDWRDCLRESVEQLGSLQKDADTLYANSAVYIRPILLVQVQRTGADKRETGFIHAEDARQFLLTAGLSAEQIAIKSAEINDLKAQDLMSSTNPIRVIITKQALQEGWDCPFAYVLCSLAASSNLSAMTQLVGRVLRQPYAVKTGNERLDQCYVFCHHAATRDVVDGIKEALEKDGMADLAGQVRETESGDGNGAKTRKLKRRGAFDKTEIYMPVVNWVEGAFVRPLDYEQDILLPLEWRGVRVASLAARIPKTAAAASSQVTQITVTEDAEAQQRGEFFPTLASSSLEEFAAFDPVYATRMIADIVPNPWVGRELVGQLVTELKARGFDDNLLGRLSSLLIEELRKHLATERDRLAETHFFNCVKASSIQFRLRTDTHNWRMPFTMDTEHPANAAQLQRVSGEPIAKSVFAPVYKGDYNEAEGGVACYLDETKALIWWHRNVAKAGQYFVQGWRKAKVYPDFIFAIRQTSGGMRYCVVETKGDQLEGSLDTVYKRKLLETVDELFEVETVTTPAGTLEIVLDGGTRVTCQLVLMSEVDVQIPRIVSADEV